LNNDVYDAYLIKDQSKPVSESEGIQKGENNLPYVHQPYYTLKDSKLLSKPREIKLKY